MANPRIGTYLPDGSLEYPTETLAGAPFALADEFGREHPPAHLHNLGDGKHFAVGDVWPPKGFDVNAELDKLRVELTPAPVSAAKKADKADEAKP